jgi:4-aminobutyrate aminotransferase-like enzyme
MNEKVNKPQAVSSSSTKLHADQLRDDPRIVEAKRLLKEALADHSRPIDGVRGPASDLTAGYEQLLQRLATARGGATYFPYLTSGIGNGPFVELADGSVKLDFIAGIGVHGLGHSHPRMLESSIDAALEDTVMQGNLQQNPETIEMCEKLIKLANQHGAKLAHCLLSTSGAMANENALKIAFHNRFPGNRVLAIDNCFAGRTLALSQLTDRPQYRTGLPQAVQVDHLPMFQPANAERSIEDASAMLRKLLARHPGEYTNLWMEMVAGEGGYYPGTPKYFRTLIDPCKQQNILIIMDEVQTFTRLSTPFAFQHFGLDEFVDIVTIGKITQVCATLYRDELKPKGPLLSQTFTASSASLAAGLVVLDELLERECFGKDGWNMRRHAYFAKKLEDLSKRYPGKLSGPFGEGMMIAFTPGQGSEAEAKTMVMDLYHAGLMSFIAGSNPARIRFLPPPAITTEAHIDLACSIIERVLQTTKEPAQITK